MAGPDPAPPVAPLEAQEAMRYVDHAPDGVVMVDGSGVIRYANTVARHMLGRDGDVVGSEFGFPLADGAHPLEIETRGRDGEVRATEMRLTPVGTTGGTGWVVALRDVTGRVEAARELLGALQQRDDALAVTSNELRNPLAVLGQASQALADAWDELPAIRRLELLRRINRQIFRISDTVTRVLDAARMDAGLFRPEPQRVPLLELVIDGLPSLGAVPEGLQIHVDDRCAVSMDAEHAWTVVSNLLTNAAVHAPGGPVVLEAVREDDEIVVLTVSDEGPGIPPEDRDRVFERFARLGRSDSEGAGLGLWVVRSVAEAYGGSASVGDPDPAVPGEEPRGARFTVRLPAAPPEDGIEEHGWIDEP